MVAGSTKRHQDHEEEEDRAATKRQRLDDDSSPSEEDDLEEILTTNTTPSLIEHNDIALPIDEEDGFVEGSIVKITLTNFVTYDYCEVFPDPQMNMIIGPNGTGKSTIVCAIALGLGGTPALLGRAKNIQEFVKTGQDEATISIELKKVNDRNIVIQRSFKKSSNSTVWKVNGKSTTYKEVLNIVHSLNIQVDNLCQFLPQDRVAEFAELAPPQLLEKTQEAVGEKQLYEMQQKLIDLRNKQKALQHTLKSDIDHLATLNARNEDLRRDVDRMKQKQKILNEVELLKAQEPLIKYSEVNKQLEDLKKQVEEQKAIVRKVNAEYAPLQELLKEHENELKKTIAKSADEAKNCNGYTQELKDLLVKIKTIKDGIDARKADIKAIEKRIPEKEQKVRSMTNRINELEETLKEPPSNDTSEIEANITSINREISEQRDKNDEVQSEARELAIKKRQESRQIENKNQRLNDMKNTLNIRLQHLQQYHPDTFKAYNWLKEHRQEFKGRVYNPILLELNLKDSRYASHIERILGGFRSNMLRTIVFENEEDYIKFTRFAADEQKWRITAALPEELSDDLLNKPTTTEELREKFKFEHYMVDLVQAPKYLLKYICLETKMNMIPVSLKPTDERHIANSGIFQKFTAAQSYYNVRPNRYRHGTYQTEVNHLPPARVLNDSVDNEERRNLIESIRTHQANMQQCEQDLKELSKKKDTIDQAIRELEFKKSDLQSQKRDIHIAAQQYEARKRRLRQLVEERDQLKNEPEEDRVKMDRYKEMIQELIEEEAEHLSNYTNIAEKMVEAYRACSRRKLESIVATAKYDALKSYIRNQASALEEAQKTLSSYKREHDMLANRVKTLMGAVRTAGKELPDGLREEFTAVVRHWKENGPTYTVEELGLKIREKEGEASAIRYANPDAMRHFEERMSKINQLQRTIDVRKRDLEEINAKITELREQWEPRIDSLIKRISDKFSEAFQRIGCAGEVGIDKQEDFDKWGAQIRVKFRNTEKLQVLTGQRQSGGERSVSTILYLMSLQSLAKTPFRVVDEINQGMDPRNERLIHQQIVEGASRSGTSQYFLITPKLLPDLYYNEQMRVLCIYNGEWVPNKISPLEKYLAHARAHPEVV